ncbi:MAG TPA: hypothetical protein PKO09_16020 [Anaerolineae bacterium]|nr:hypothetical protein [Anaerolineae bacterium]
MSVEAGFWRDSPFVPAMPWVHWPWSCAMGIGGLLFVTCSVRLGGTGHACRSGRVVAGRRTMQRMAEQERSTLSPHDWRPPIDTRDTQ